MPFEMLPLIKQTKSLLPKPSPMDAMTMDSPSALVARLSPRKRLTMDPADNQQLIRAATPPSSIR